MAPATSPRIQTTWRIFCSATGHVALVARKDFDPEFGAQSMQDNPPDSSFTFSPYTVTVDPNE